MRVVENVIELASIGGFFVVMAFLSGITSGATLV
jgi:hypothetical protein